MKTMSYIYLFFKNLDPKRISLWRYQDPELGPRKIPTAGDLEKGKVRLSDSVTFHVDLEKKTVATQENGSRFDIGSKLVYTVQE